MKPSEAAFDVAIIGGGPAGCSAAIIAARLGARVLLLERGRFPRHKVCGEFISPESLELLRSLLPPPDAQRLLDHAPRIELARIFLGKHPLEARISPPAASLSRYALDAALWDAARQSGVDCRHQTEVSGVSSEAAQQPPDRTHHFRIQSTAGNFTAHAIVNASGRWSRISPSRVEPSRSPRSGPHWIGLKAHFIAKSSDPTPSTDLYVFTGGYCGVQPVLGEGDEPRMNVCAMVRADIATTVEQVLHLHPDLKQRSRGWRLAMDVVSTSPLVFRRPQPVHDGVLQAGDAAGFIDPFVGDGIAIALRSGAIAGELLADVAAGNATLEAVTRQYAERYRKAFLPPFRNARRLRRLMELPALLRTPLVRALRFPGAAEFLVKTTRSVGAD